MVGPASSPSPEEDPVPVPASSELPEESPDESPDEPPEESVSPETLIDYYNALFKKEGALHRKATLRKA